jgi:biopolymer transport protein ExbD
MNDEQVPRPNMTPMIDVVFQLLVFFLVSMKFKTLDMKLEAFLPKDIGPSPIQTHPEDRVKLTARLDRPASGQARIKLDGRILGNTDDPAAWQRLDTIVRDVRARYVANGGDPSVVEAEVDAVPLVATGLVVRTIDAFAAAEIEHVRFTGTPLATRRD